MTKQYALQKKTKRLVLYVYGILLDHINNAFEQHQTEYYIFRSMAQDIIIRSYLSTKVVKGDGTLGPGSETTSGVVHNSTPRALFSLLSAMIYLKFIICVV